MADAYTITPGADFGDPMTPTKDFNLHGDRFQSPTGLWSDGETMWMTGLGSGDKVIAYRMTPGANFGDRDESKEFDLVPDNDDLSRRPVVQRRDHVGGGQGSFDLTRSTPTQMGPRFSFGDRDPGRDDRHDTGQRRTLRPVV